MARSDSISFRTADDAKNAPGPHVGIVGRSNVGKSSLLNRLLRWKLAAVSRTPGRTKSIRLYPFGPGWLADLPGYGYARVGYDLRDKWDVWMREFYGNNPNLAGTVVLVDGRHPATDRDLELRQWLRGLDTPFLVVLTKWDLVRTNHKRALLAEHALVWGLEPGDLFCTSAREAEGIERLKTGIERLMTGASGG